MQLLRYNFRERIDCVTDCIYYWHIDRDVDNTNAYIRLN